MEYIPHIDDIYWIFPYMNMIISRGDLDIAKRNKLSMKYGIIFNKIYTFAI